MNTHSLNWIPLTNCCSIASSFSLCSADDDPIGKSDMLMEYLTDLGTSYTLFPCEI